MMATLQATLQSTGQRACHKQIREVAKEAAAHLYESRMSNNQLYDLWKEQNPGIVEPQLLDRFVRKYWPQMIGFARATLAQMLTRPEIDDKMKMEIMDILEKDQYLRNKFADKSVH